MVYLIETGADPAVTPINGLPRVISSPSILFADETKLLQLIADYHSSQQLQNDILTLKQWSKLWQLNFNNNKSFIGKQCLLYLLHSLRTC